MAFINEHISADDIEKYDIESIDKRFIVGGVSSKNWTIDRERNIYLRIVARVREDYRHESTWTFFWNGELLLVELDNIKTDGKAGGERTGHKRIRRLEIPQHLKSHRDEIIDDLKEALTAYKDGGVYATATEYTLILDV